MFLVHPSKHTSTKSTLPSAAAGKSTSTHNPHGSSSSSSTPPGASTPLAPRPSASLSPRRPKPRDPCLISAPSTTSFSASPPTTRSTSQRGSPWTTRAKRTASTPRAKMPPLALAISPRCPTPTETATSPAANARIGRRCCPKTPNHPMCSSTTTFRSYGHSKTTPS